MPETDMFNPLAETTEGDPLKGVGAGLPKLTGMLGGVAGLFQNKEAAAVMGAATLGLGVGNALAPYVFGAEPKGTSMQEVPPDGDFKPTSGNQTFDAMLEGGMGAFDYLGL